MYGRSENPGQWSVYAEFTISHPGAGDPENVPITRTEQNDNSVRMTYSWNSQRNHNESWTSTSNIPSENTSQQFEPGSYNFQKGNLLFTSTPPPRRPANFQTTRLNAPESSGYGSNLLSPNSMSSSASMHHQEGNKCRSTCNITLCSNQGGDSNCHNCGRTQSLRCQTPSSRSDYKNAYYGCGDPWCHHSRSGDDCRFSPVMEMEECPSPSTKSHKITTRSLSRELEGRSKDASVQTFEMVDKCTSPFLKVDDDLGKNKKSKKVRKRSLSSYTRRPEPIYQRSHSPSSFTPDSLESNTQPHRRLTRSPKLKRIPTVADNSDVTTTTTATDDKSSGSKKPRTVHIDVYCTGTEPESDSSDLSGNETASTPQTVFESEQVKITHKRADLNAVPKGIEEQNVETSQNKSDSDVDDGASTAYPSKLSSYSTIKDFTSSISSVPRSSWTNYSMSSCAVPDFDCDSIANTSWKDNTYSDLDSVLQSRSSMAGTESLLFVPKRLRQKSYSIDETPELASQATSLHQSDSFEYANSEDKLRIKRMEMMWKKEEEKRKLMEKSEARKREQERKMNEYIKRKCEQLTKKESKESDSDDSADSGKGWTFVKDDSKKLERDTTIRRNSKDVKKNDSTNTTTKEIRRKPILVDQGSLSDSTPSPSCRTPSSALLMQRLSLDPSLRAPFTIAPGQYTEQRSIARKFGPVIGAFRKPGHHVGPVRNPECSCAHCRSYHETRGFRTRTRSLGDPPTQNWKCQN